MITIFYEKKSGNVTINKTVTFDPIYGDQTNIRGKKFGVSKMDGSGTLKDHLAFQKLIALEFENLIPDLPVLPDKTLTIGESKWKKFPENMPTINDVVYQCRDAVNRNKIMFLEYHSPEQINAWYTFGVYDFCLATDVSTYSQIPNPEYALVKAERDEIIANYKNVTLKQDLGEGYKLKPICLVPYGNIPDTDGYRWWIVNQDGTRTEIPVVKGKYPQYKWVLMQSPEVLYATAANNIAKGYTKFDIIKKMLGI